MLFKNIFLNLLWNTFSDSFPDMGVTDHRHYARYDRKKKLESLRLQECSLRNRSLWKLEASFLRNCFYIQYRRGRREITSFPVQKFCFLLCSTRWRNISLFYTTFVLTIQKRSRFEPVPPQSTICSYAPERVCIVK